MSYISQEKTKETKIEIAPDYATVKTVKYSSSDESICTIDQNGVVTGIHYGNATITVTTDSDDKSHTINVKVIANVPFAVDLNKNELDMLVGTTYQLDAVVDAPVALNKTVHYSSSNPEIIYVDPDTGKLTAYEEGTATITVTTESGGLTDTCVVTATKGTLPIELDFSAIAEYSYGVYEFKTNNINLRDYLRVDPEKNINIDDVVITLPSGTTAATIVDGVLTFNKSDIYVFVHAYVGDVNNPDYFFEAEIVFAG